ncbi:alpha-hydroxy-acid oxidizing enzyme [Mycobacterium sp. 852013-50091_SCH5140682]|uniref:alpha-hydroxy acid oxidase n=1 Tax=Mycobacterium sp. 852013-50091_SCH5140682 TaxID=1834109 RepID=UPI0007E9CCD0|nr:alpha-hydroxy acid oxidase [Mycobacterium sp. 852013-50091_SCH5140682]OBC01698.1 alpha-hydroxy-acid oxidizing enzyme [Mycobacterium sp. 852013-50091_SCH5140682]
MTDVCERPGGRQWPRWSEIAPLLTPKPFVLNGPRRRAASAACTDDFRRISRRRAPRAVFDYVDGGAENEVSLRRSRQMFDRIEFCPRVLHDVGDIDTSSTVLGRPAAMPVIIGPTGFTRVMHRDGERAVARAAAAAGIPYALSTMGTTSIESVAQAAPRGRRWFQLYLWRDRDKSRELIERAALAGYEALVMTVDTAVPGSRLRDVRNGMTIPPRLSVRTFLDGAIRPWWWFDLLTTPQLEFASLHNWHGTVAELAQQLFDPTITTDDLAWLRSCWPGKLIVKGVQSADDAVRAVDCGVDGIVVSNHGGRQLDRARVPLEQLPTIAAAVGGQAEIFVDGGITNGADVVAALCMGASAALLGRAPLYALMAAGEHGVRRLTAILHDEIGRTMQLLGARSIKDLTPDHIRLRDN